MRDEQLQAALDAVLGPDYDPLDPKASVKIYAALQVRHPKFEGLGELTFCMGDQWVRSVAPNEALHVLGVLEVHQNSRVDLLLWREPKEKGDEEFIIALVDSLLKVRVKSPNVRTPFGAYHGTGGFPDRGSPPSGPDP